MGCDHYHGELQQIQQQLLQVRFLHTIYKQGFQSNANRPLANSPAYVVSKFEHARGQTDRLTESITFPHLRWQAVKISEWLNKSDAVVDYRSTPKRSIYGKVFDRNKEYDHKIDVIGTRNQNQ